MNMPPTTGGAPENHVVCEIETWLKINGWKFWHLEQQRHMKKGTADIIAGFNGMAIWIEAKARPGLWMTRLGKYTTVRAGVQRPGQKKFQDYWQDDIPYVTADRWEAVAEAVKQSKNITRPRRERGTYD